MATQAEIIACEDVLIKSLELVRSGRPCDTKAVRDALRQASEMFAQELNERRSHENRDYWKTLGVNADVLGSSISDANLAGECISLAILLGIHI